MAAPERIHPLLWPLAAYLAVGTLVLFLVSQVDAAAAYVLPWTARRGRWHEGSAGWMTLFPITAPVLLAYAVTRLGFALPARAIHLIGSSVMWLWDAVGAALARAWTGVRTALARARVTVQTVLRDVRATVRRNAELAVRRVREALARLSRR